jgi:hypothetical protein
MKLYKGVRTHKGCKVTVTNGEGKTYDLKPRTDLKAHTPDGTFEWGYNGQGPSQLALAIVSDATGDDAYSLATYPQLRAYIVSRLPYDGWEMTEPNVREFC